MMIRLDLTVDEFTSLIAHFGFSVNIRTHGGVTAHHHLAMLRLPREVHEGLTLKLIAAMEELKRSGVIDG